MARKKKEDLEPDKILELIDEQVKIRGDAVLAVEDTSARIAELASEARRKGITMPELTQRIKRMDKHDRKLVPVTRQAVDTMVAVHDKRREPRTTRESRRRRETETTPARPSNSKLTEEQVQRVRDMKGKVTQTALAEELGVTKQRISEIQRKAGGKINVEALQ